MDLFGIGIGELLFILIIILLVAGPKDIAKTARNLGRGLNRIYKSPNYQIIRKASQEIRNLPARLAREAHLEELDELKAAKKDLEAAANAIGQEAAKPFQAWVEDMSPPKAAPAQLNSPPAGRASPPAEPEPTASPLSMPPTDGGSTPAGIPASAPAAQRATQRLKLDTTTSPPADPSALEGAAPDRVPAGAPTPEQDPADQ
jgi:Sec-independent protein translocase protein TatA